ncbi:hypothetical protein KsCSTR_26160 [Candidatus Kuenenia stuttgartiensis]|uniref:Uncharacterized protein n=1 Tax=Kuenenia stuttgartiensis TaxID=174633 RepID=A0A6G7GR60_KUEST|nr:hypothetical protein KsCSTR_26160 [Candidatus Kuenenia stuttgartiensis]
MLGLGYSSISRRVTIMESTISKDDDINERLTRITNQGLTPYSYLSKA